MSVRRPRPSSRESRAEGAEDGLRRHRRGVRNGAKAEAPPAQDTFDLMEMMGELEGLGADSEAGLSA
ncbi:hypothetical protein GCM10010294_61130 [Streptomyces griseoloalbus]|nr:hypothetical protein GCM10010294_61130 [Streptomyces griseoloalbus]